MSKPNRPWRSVYHPNAFEPLLRSSATDTEQNELSTAAFLAIDNIASGAMNGKHLGERHVSGNLSGLYRARFDLENFVGNPRYRVVYALDHETDPTTIKVIAVGPRLQHLVYRAATENIRP